VEPDAINKHHKELLPPFIWVYINSEPFVGFKDYFTTGSVTSAIETLSERFSLDKRIVCPPPTTLSEYVHSPLWNYSLAINMAISLQLAMVFNAPHIHFMFGLTANRELQTAHEKLTSLEQVVLSASESTEVLPMGLSSDAAKELRPRIVRNHTNSTRKFVSRPTRIKRQRELELRRETETTYLIALTVAFIEGAPLPRLKKHPPAKDRPISKAPLKEVHLHLVHSTRMHEWGADSHHFGVPRYEVQPGCFFPVEITQALSRFKVARANCETETNIDRAYMHRVKDLLLKAFKRLTVSPCSISVNNVICTLYAKRGPGMEWPLPGVFYTAIMTAMRKIISGETNLPPGLDLRIEELSIRDTTRAKTTTNTLQALSILGPGWTVRLGLPSPTKRTKRLAVHSSFSAGQDLIPVAASLMATLLQTAGFSDATIRLKNSSPKITGQATMTLPFIVNDAAPIFVMGDNPGAQSAFSVMTNYTTEDHGRSRTLPAWMEPKATAAKLNSGIRFSVYIGNRVTSVAVHKQSLVLTGKSDLHDFTVSAIAVCLQLSTLTEIPWALQPLKGCSFTFARRCIETLVQTHRCDLPTFGIGSPCLTLDNAPPNALRILPNGEDSVMHCILRAVLKSN
jgi:hypothetical protein